MKIYGMPFVGIVCAFYSHSFFFSVYGLQLFAPHDEHNIEKCIFVFECVTCTTIQCYL